jgi:hypothetical protein
VAGVGVALYYGIKLQDFIAEPCALCHTVENELFADMKTTDFGINRITCVTDMAASSDVVRVEDVKTYDPAVIFCDACITL